MSKEKYIVGTGYFSQPGRGQDWFWNIWFENTRRYMKPEDIFVLASGRSYAPITDPQPEHCQWLYLEGNLGHTGDILNGKKPHRFCGCLGGMMQLALTAYCNETDLVYKEQDCLAFGPCVEQMYAEIGSHGVIVGRSHFMGIALSLILVRHAFIPDFVRLYLGTPAENNPHEMPEGKIGRLMQTHPDLFCAYSFGVDRDRPLPIGSVGPWYAQKFTHAEMLALKQNRLIDDFEIPEINAPTFSNA